MIRKIKYIILLLIILLVSIIAIFLNGVKDNSLVNSDDSYAVPDHIIYDGESFYSDKNAKIFSAMTSPSEQAVNNTISDIIMPLNNPVIYPLL